MKPAEALRSLKDAKRHDRIITEHEAAELLAYIHVLEGRKPRARQCRKCAKKPKIGGCAMTLWRCELCGSEGMSGSTCHPKLCADCASGENRCYYCGERHP